MVVLAAVMARVTAAALVTVGRRRIADVKALPQTTETIKEDVAWAKAQTS